MLVCIAKFSQGIQDSDLHSYSAVCAALYNRGAPGRKKSFVAVDGGSVEDVALKIK